MLNFIRIKNIDHFDLDDPKRTIRHREIIKSKKTLKRLYIEWYTSIKNICMANLPEGRIIELGSGGGFLKEVWPEIITSDILELPDNDLTFNALRMPFPDNSIAAFVMVDVFHHVPDSNVFLEEMNRCLKTGGKIVMSEPCTTWFSKIIFKNFHHEPFNEKGDWTIPGTGPMSDANGALPYIVFERDFGKFSRLFPDLKIKKIRKHTPFLYLLTGGVSFISIVPSFLYKPIRVMENVISDIFPSISLFQFIEIRKK